VQAHAADPDGVVDTLARTATKPSSDIEILKRSFDTSYLVGHEGRPLGAPSAANVTSCSLRTIAHATAWTVNGIESAAAVGDEVRRAPVSFPATDWNFFQT